jgi:hypothetical protein
MATSTLKLQVAAAAVSLVLVSLLVLRVSSAAFSAQTDNPDNSWATGQIDLSDDDGGGAASAMFDVTGMVPGQTVTKCITVTYTGGVDPGVVKVFADVTDGGLGDHLDVTVKEGNGGAYGNCTGFSATATLESAVTLNAFAAHADYATGAGTWNPSATGQAKTYQFVATLGSDTPDSVQGADAQATFTWETTT